MADPLRKCRHGRVFDGTTCPDCRDATDCKHMDFSANVGVARLEDSGRFNAEIRIRCAHCNTDFRFLGLKVGLDTAGAMMSPDGLEARIAIVPVGEEQKPWDGPTGFKITMNGTH